MDPVQLGNSISYRELGFAAGSVAWLGPSRSVAVAWLPPAGVFTVAFDEVLKAGGLRVITTLPRRPRMNAVCERVIGTLRRELPDRTLILNEHHLGLALREYVRHYNGHRPHQSRRQRPPDIETQPVRDAADLRSIRRKPAAAGLINEYHHAA